MKVLLIIPPFYRLMGSSHNGLSLGSAYLSSFLLQKGFDARIYNADYSPGAEYADVAGLIASGERHKAILADHAHPIWQEIRATIQEWVPDVVGISIFTAAYKSAQNIALICRELNPEVKIVAGGWHPTIDPDELMSCTAYDFAIRGEGEYVLWQLLRGDDLGSIKGLSYREGNRVIHNPSAEFIDDLDALPFPTRTPGHYLNPLHSVDLGIMITSRGCPFSCTFCASPVFWKRRVRYRSIESVVHEMGVLYKKLGIETIRFYDDTFTLQRERVVQLARALIARAWPVKWICNVRVDCIDRELLALMKKAGCVQVRIGVESGNDETLKLIRKRITTATVKRAVAAIRSVGLRFAAYFIIGFPNEDDAMVRSTIDFARKLQADHYSLSVLTPYYGTKIWDTFTSSHSTLDRDHWEFFFHQSNEMLMARNIDRGLVEEFLSLNELRRVRH